MKKRERRMELETVSATFMLWEQVRDLVFQEAEELGVPMSTIVNRRLAESFGRSDLLNARPPRLGRPPKQKVAV